MNDAIQMNNRGVALLVEGNYTSALSNLKKAAEFMHTLTKTGEQELKRHADKDLRGAMDHKDHYEDHHNFSTYFTAAPAVLKGQRFRQSDRSVVIHDAPFNIPLTLQMTTSTATVVGAVVLFNMALTYQLAKQCPLIPHANENALSLYEMAYILAEKYCKGVNMTPIIVACINNLGCLHYELGEFDCARTYLGNLVQFNRKDPNGCTTLAPRDQLTILRNTDLADIA
jgi:tetratricopeptide (TPR) repeat protein